ncbi:MAG: N-acetylmuramoyl-L-alanine amidase [Bacillota bacterium]|nr:N-acetylmuramoyl-L-alanine amidase [Bacillota bacterium]
MKIKYSKKIMFIFKSTIVLLSVLFVIILTSVLYYKQVLSSEALTYSEKANALQTGAMMNNTPTALNSIKPTPAPTEALVVIDPGHGGEDLGTYSGQVYEKEVNLDISLRLGQLLKKEGIKILLTRDKDIFVGLRERSNLANEREGTLFISIHNNNMPDDSGYKGTETLYCPSGGFETKEMNGERFAAIVQDALVKRLNTVNIGTIARPNLSVLHRTKMPAIIAEIGYISNYGERNRLDSGSFRQEAADALCSAIIKTMKEMNAQKGTDNRWMIQY